MSTNENTGSVPDLPEQSPVLRDAGVGPDQHATEQPVTVAGGVVGPLETAIEESEKGD